MAKVFLFVYGRLQHEYSPPETMSSWSVDAVRGSMFHLPDENDVALINPGFPHAPWCRGELMTIEDSELASLDESEDGYARQLITTKNGYRAWIYVYQSAPPVAAKQITRWEGHA